MSVTPVEETSGETTVVVEKLLVDCKVMAIYEMENLHSNYPVRLCAGEG